MHQDVPYQHYLTVALAQAPVVDGQIQTNLYCHLEYIAAAAAHRADIVVFPELSLTGYVLNQAASLMLKHDAPEIQALKRAAISNKIVVIAGGFFDLGLDKPVIAALICRPCGHVDIYAKQYLHQGEALYCCQGQQPYLLAIKDVHLALAICADFNEPTHAQESVNIATDFYLVSALISNQGFATDSAILAGIARKHQCTVLLANHVTHSGGWQACGQSGYWTPDGQSQLATHCPGLMLCYYSSNGIHGQEMGVL